MKFISKKYLIFSFLLAFLFSLISLQFIFPNFFSLAYTNILNSNIPGFSPIFFFKVFSTLLIQTSALGFIFYNIAKKLF